MKVVRPKDLKNADGCSSKRGPLEDRMQRVSSVADIVTASIRPARSLSFSPLLFPFFFILFLFVILFIFFT